MSDRILAHCPCGKAYRVPATAAGKKGRCKECGGVFEVPFESASAPPPLTPLTPLVDERDTPFPERGPAVPRRRPADAGLQRRRGAGAPPRRSKPVPASSRVPLVVGALAVLLIAGGGITLAVTGWNPFRDKTALDYIPVGMDVVMQINVKDAYQELGFEKEDLLSDPVSRRAFERMEAAGFDPFEDLESVYFAMDISGMAAGQMNILGIITISNGSVEESLLKSFQEEKGLEEASHRGHTYYTYADIDVAPGVNMAIGALNDKMMAIGTESALKRAFDTADGELDSILDDDEMSDILDDANTDALFWAAARMPSMLGQAVPEAKDFKSLLVSADHRDSVLSIEVVGRFATAEGAQTAYKAVNEALEMFDRELAKVKEGEQPEDLPISLEGVDFDDLIVGKSLEADGETLRLAVKIDTSSVKEVFETLKEDLFKPTAEPTWDELEPLEVERWEPERPAELDPEASEGSYRYEAEPPRERVLTGERD